MICHGSVTCSGQRYVTLLALHDTQVKCPTGKVHLGRVSRNAPLRYRTVKSFIIQARIQAGISDCLHIVIFKNQMEYYQIKIF